MRVRPLGEDDRNWLRGLIAQEWGIPVVSISGAYDPINLAGFVALEDDRPIGVVTYRMTDEQCEIVTLNSLEENKGVGTALLKAVRVIADQNGVRLWLITTDDNDRAVCFYENRGMTRAALHRDFSEVVRRYKPLDESDIGATTYDAIEFTY